jgi:hypothetical protein
MLLLSRNLLYLCHLNSNIMKMKETKNEVQGNVVGRPGSETPVGGGNAGNGSNQGNSGNNPGSGNESGGVGHVNQISIQVRYQSDVVSVSINKNASVEALLVEAIRSTENEIGKKDQFQLKLGGTVLDPHKKVSDYPITEGTLLVLGLVAGGGGSFPVRTTKCGS